jgi:predicted alpha-1,2-mannosidase
MIRFNSLLTSSWLLVIASLLAPALLSSCGSDAPQSEFQPSPPAASAAPVDQVDPFIATAVDFGQQHPAAMVPWGMVKLGPDTYPSTPQNDAHTGYNYADTSTLGFSHVRYGGMGANGMGAHIPLLPRTGPVALVPEKYAVPMDKRREQASPGYYSIDLKNGVAVQLTAAPQTGLHRYTFPLDAPDAHVMLDLSHGLTEVTAARLAVTGERTFEGWVRPRHRFDKNQTYTLHFAGEWNRPPRRHSLWQGVDLQEGAAEQEGPVIGGVFWFDTAAPVMAKVALSTIDAATARAAMAAEIPDWNFDAVHQAARTAWSRRLESITVEGGTPGERRLFYTSLYRALAEPMDVTAPDGRYLSHAMDVQTASDWRFYDGYSTWDEFRTKFPLLALVAPDVMSDVARSLAQGEARPRTGTFPFLVVRMDMMAPILLDAAAKDLADFDLNPAMEGLLATARNQTMPDYEQVGFLPGQPDKTLEVAYFDWAVAELAQRLGRPDDEARFRARAAFYRNIFNPRTGYFQPREPNGEWHDLGDPTDFNKRAWYEGSPAHWRWFVPHDPDGLMQLMGGPDKLVAALDEYFNEGYHSMTNEIALHAPYLYTAAGRYDRARQTAHRCLTQTLTHRFGSKSMYNKPAKRPAFQPAPDGMLPEMDDDGGTMSAWYVWSTLGLYPLCPGQPRYALGWPLFDRAEIRLEGGKTFVIERAPGARPDDPNPRALLNGAPLAEPFLTHAQLTAGGTLRVE